MRVIQVNAEKVTVCLTAGEKISIDQFITLKDCTASEMNVTTVDIPKQDVQTILSKMDSVNNLYPEFRYIINQMNSQTITENEKFYVAIKSSKLMTKEEAIKDAEACLEEDQCAECYIAKVTNKITRKTIIEDISK